MRGIHQGHGDGGHAQRLAVAGAGEDHVFHAGAAQAASGLLAQHPTDGIAEVATCRSRSVPTTAAMPVPVEAQFGASQNDLKPCISTRLSFSNALTSPASGEL